MRIANVLLVGVESTSLPKQLERFGYGTIEVADVESIIKVTTPFALMLIDERCMTSFDTKSVERLYFLNNSAPTAVLIHNPEVVKPSLHRMIYEGTFEPVYLHEIENGFICSRIDRIYISSQVNKNMKQFQQTFHERETLKRELSLHEKILTQERVINTNILGSITSGLIVIDNDDVIILVNEYVRELLPVGDVIGAKYEQSLPNEIAVSIEELKVISPDRRTHVMHKNKIGARFLEVSAFRMLDYQTSPTGILVMLHDVTELENTSVQLFRSEKLATVGTMLSGIAHELRNPLAIISARAQRALTAGTTDMARIRKGFESIEKQAQRCATIVNNLLDFTRQTATSAGYHNAAEVLDETLAYVDYQNIFDNVAVVKRYASDLLIYGDRSRFVQVFLNIITNAVDAMDSSGTLTITTSSEGNGFTKIEINDTGPGISPEVESKVFDPFFTTKEPGKGTGLGLAIVFKIVQQSNGTIWFNSRPGSTSFFIKLPSTKEAGNE